MVVLQLCSSVVEKIIILICTRAFDIWLFLVGELQSGMCLIFHSFLRNNLPIVISGTTRLLLVYNLQLGLNASNSVQYLAFCFKLFLYEKHGTYANH